MIKIYYDPMLGEAIPDGWLEYWFSKISDAEKANDDKEFWFSTENIIYRIRLGVLRDEIDRNKVVFDFFGDQDITMDEYGHCSVYPGGFADTIAKINEKLLNGMFEKSLK